MKMEKQLFITDFDGTLLRDDKTISREDIKTLKILRQKKIITAIATGRSLYSFEKALAALGMMQNENFLSVDYIIFSTGAGIMEYPGGNVFYQKALPALEIGKITRYFDQEKFDYMVHKSIPDTRYFFYKSHGTDNPDFHERIALYKTFAFPLENDHKFSDPATEVLAIIPGGANLNAVDTIKNKLSCFSVIHATSPLDHKSSWIEVFHKDVSKARAALRLIKMLGIKRKNVVSVGNDYNDQDLLAWSGKGFVVENAPESLKQVFQTVSPNNNCGVTGAAGKSGLLG